MRASAAAIKAKYANMPPPDDWPLIGDTVEFTDRMNGRKYAGEVQSVNDIPRVKLIDHCWWVRVTICFTTGETSDGGDVFSVQHGEITRVIRKKQEGA